MLMGSIESPDHNASPKFTATSGWFAVPVAAASRKIVRFLFPSCRRASAAMLCSGLIVWFGESLWEDDLRRCDQALRACDLLLVIGTSGVVYPAAGFASVAKEVGALVIEINLESTPQSNLVDLSLQGRAKDLVPLLL
jgi:NAD-dependent deacetylase